MLELLRDAFYLSGGLTVVGMLVLPVLFLVIINAVYFLLEMFGNVHERGGASS